MEITDLFYLAGCTIIGFMLPEVLGTITKVRIPIGMNLLTAFGVSLIVLGTL